MIKVLPQDIISQIAAGEVIERPASVLKELLDNALDSTADSIDVYIKDGGLSLIEVRDNGVGISSDNFDSLMKNHATSKVFNLEDIANIQTYGFRGEALASINSVSDMFIQSKVNTSETGYKVRRIGENVSVEPIAMNKGTAVVVKDLFSSVPARLKYMRSESTEYKYILEVFKVIVLANPQVSFRLFRDEKLVLDFPKLTEDSIKLHPERVAKVLGVDNSLMIDIFVKSNDSVIGGYIFTPKEIPSLKIGQYLYINGRPVTDFGITKSIKNAYRGYLPEGWKVPYIISIETSSSNVDINVHPRKEEVRFYNPFRIYSTVENLVRNKLTTTVFNKIRKSFGIDSDDNAFNRLRGGYGNSNSSGTIDKNTKESSYGVNQFDGGTSNDSYSKLDSNHGGGVSLFEKSRGVYTHKTKRNSISDAMEFSKALLNIEKSVFDSMNIEEQGYRSIYQLFNKYILIEYTNYIIFVDQHAAAERVNYEKIGRDYPELEQQFLLEPITIDRELVEEEVVIKLLDRLSLEYSIDEKYIYIKSRPEIVPEDRFEQGLQILRRDYEDTVATHYNSIDMVIEYFKASISCHNSIRTGKKLSVEEMERLISDLLSCENPSSCPHGRPTIWRMELTELDSKFLRTY